MKTILLLITVLLMNFTFAQSAWERINPKPQENSIMDIMKIPNTEDIIVVCRNSTLMTSTNGGVNWEVRMNPANLPNNIHLNDVDFIDSHTGYIACSYGIVLKTIDGGDSWDSIKVGDKHLKNLHITSADKIITSGSNGGIYISNNAGIEWQEIDAGTDFDITAMTFPSTLKGYMIDRTGVLFETNNGGESWELLLDMEVLDGDILFPAEGSGYIVGQKRNVNDQNTYVFYTNNNGASWDTVWSELSFDSAILDMYGEELLLTGLKWFYEGKIYSSTDQGLNWTEYELPLKQSEKINLLPLSQDEFIITGDFGQILETEDHFQTWINLDETQKFGNVNELQLIDGTFYTGTTDYYYIYGIVQGSLFKSTDGGYNWQEMKSGYPVNNIHFLDQNTGYSVSYDEIAKSDNGFEEYYTFYSGYPYSVFFFNEDIGLISVDEWSQTALRKTMDGGNSWYTVFSAIQKGTGKFVFVDAQKGFALGNIPTSYPSILRTLDAGETWMEYEIPANQLLTDIFFVNETTGFVTTWDNSYYKTTDGGESWKLQELVYDIYLKTVFFVDESVGYLAGAGPYNTILKTTDGGSTWFPIEKPSTNPIYRMHFFDENNGIVFGRYGLISKTETGGQVGQHEILTVENSFELQAYPNPFSDQIKLTFAPVFGENIALSIYDIHGRLIRQARLSNQNKYIWDGTDQLGKKVKGGVYVCRVSDGKQNATGTLLFWE